MSELPLIPVTLLTGFLGAGKTTLVSRLLSDPRFSDTAVIINEFGEVGLDHLLVTHLPDDAVIEMTSGCLCCTVRGDVRQALMMLHHRSEIGELPLFARVIIETTGLADPAPIIHTLMTDIRVERRFRLAQVVTVVDAVNAAATLDLYDEAVRQVAVADVLLVTKTDLEKATEPVLELTSRLIGLAPGATITTTASPDFDLRTLANAGGAYDVDAKPAVVLAWLNAEAFATSHNHHHHLDVSRHSGSIRSFCLAIDEPMSRTAFAFAMELLASNQGPDILRVKGLVAIDEHPDQPVVIHMVQHIVHTPLRLDTWPSTDRRTRLVFITRNLDPADIARFFQSWTKAPAHQLEFVE